MGITASERLNLLDAVIYGDVFGCAVPLDLWRYARTPIDREQLRRRMLDDLVSRRVVTARDGLYGLNGKAASIDARPISRSCADSCSRDRRLPTTRPGADVDLLVIVAAGRLGTVFLLLAPLAGLFRGRLFCPIWYMSERRLGSDSQTLYMARELAQARCLSGDAGEVFHANPWIREVFPNAVPPAPIEPRLQRHTSAQRRLVRAARRNPGSWARAWGAAPCPGSLRAHYAGFDLPIPRDVSARFEAGSALGFHGYRYEASTLRGYAGRRLDLQTSLTPFAGPS